jgi:hypothetical protein
LTVKGSPVVEDAALSVTLAGVTTSPCVVNVPPVTAVPATVTVMVAVPVSAVAGFTVTVAPVSPGPARAEQLTVPVTVGDEFSSVACIVPAPMVSAISVTNALTLWILNFDTSIEDRPSF